MRADYTVNLQTNRDYDPRPARVLTQLPIYDRLLALVDQHDALKAAGRHADARGVKEQAQCLVEQWFDDQDARDLADAEEMEQLAAARAHISATQERWRLEIAEGAPF
jgi:hypothetical protein